MKRKRLGIRPKKDTALAAEASKRVSAYGTSTNPFNLGKQS